MFLESSELKPELLLNFSLCAWQTPQRKVIYLHITRALECVEDPKPGARFLAGSAVAIPQLVKGSCDAIQGQRKGRAMCCL